MGKNATMKQLAAWLSTQVDRKVVDKTGLRGGYDFTAEWANGGANPQSSDTGAPGVFTALRAFGLKLEPRKLPFEVLVIDGANPVLVLKIERRVTYPEVRRQIPLRDHSIHFARVRRPLRAGGSGNF